MFKEATKEEEEEEEESGWGLDRSVPIKNGVLLKTQECPVQKATD